MVVDAGGRAIDEVATVVAVEVVVVGCDWWAGGPVGGGEQERTVTYKIAHRIAPRVTVALTSSHAHHRDAQTMRLPSTRTQSYRVSTEAGVGCPQLNLGLGTRRASSRTCS